MTAKPVKDPFLQAKRAYVEESSRLMFDEKACVFCASKSPNKIFDAPESFYKEAGSPLPELAKAYTDLFLEDTFVNGNDAKIVKMYKKKIERCLILLPVYNISLMADMRMTQPLVKRSEIEKSVYFFFVQLEDTVGNSDFLSKIEKMNMQMGKNMREIASRRQNERTPLPGSFTDRRSL